VGSLGVPRGYPRPLDHGRSPRPRVIHDRSVDTGLAQGLGERLALLRAAALLARRERHLVERRRLPRPARGLRGADPARDPAQRGARRCALRVRRAVHRRDAHGRLDARAGRRPPARLRLIRHPAQLEAIGAGVQLGERSLSDAVAAAPRARELREQVRRSGGTAIAADAVERPGPSARTMKVVVIGATGTIGCEVAKQLEARHEVVRASRNGSPPVDLRTRVDRRPVRAERHRRRRLLRGERASNAAARRRLRGEPAGEREGEPSPRTGRSARGRPGRAVTHHFPRQLVTYPRIRGISDHCSSLQAARMRVYAVAASSPHWAQSSAARR
jgi:hypothetical protein